MLKMKKILAILLAVCFLVSVTAAAASAYEEMTVVETKSSTVVETKSSTVVEKISDEDDEDEGHDENEEHDENEGHDEDEGHDKSYVVEEWQGGYWESS